MNEVLSYFLESVVCLGLFWLFYKLAIEEENMLNFGRFYLLSTSVFSLVFPLMNVQLPSYLFSVNKVTNEFIIYLTKVNVQEA
ncbi:MAG TPA: hypothetical protein VI583_07750, partial [Cyclobacteriaceae bacterium]|nr:hypothetical protein [Cyclobacteriaceae bacterium]